MTAMRIVGLLVFFGLLSSTSAWAQDVLGKWKTIDDETSEAKSVVEIFARDGKVYGRIIKLFRKPGEDPDPLCDQCEESDSRYKKKVIGMEIMLDMVKEGQEYAHGTILDPNNGKVYKCRIWVEGNDLKVRGYWGPFYRTQTWLKAQ